MFLVRFPIASFLQDVGEGARSGEDDNFRLSGARLTGDRERRAGGLRDLDTRRIGLLRGGDETLLRAGGLDDFRRRAGGGEGRPLLRLLLRLLSELLALRAAAEAAAGFDRASGALGGGDLAFGGFSNAFFSFCFSSFSMLLLRLFLTFSSSDSSSLGASRSYNK